MSFDYYAFSHWLHKQPGANEFVYVATHKFSENHLKIGRSTNVDRRLNELKANLILLFACSNGRSADVERIMHKQFKEWRIDGEWFEAMPVIRQLDRELPVGHEDGLRTFLWTDSPFWLMDTFRDDVPHSDKPCREDRLESEWWPDMLICPDYRDFYEI